MCWLTVTIMTRSLTLKIPPCISIKLFGKKLHCWSSIVSASKALFNTTAAIWRKFICTAVWSIRFLGEDIRCDGMPLNQLFRASLTRIFIAPWFSCLAGTILDAYDPEKVEFFVMMSLTHGCNLSVIALYCSAVVFLVILSPPRLVSWEVLDLDNLWFSLWLMKACTFLSNWLCRRMVDNSRQE